MIGVKKYRIFITSPVKFYVHSDWTPESHHLLSHWINLLLFKQHFVGALEPKVSNFALTDCTVLVEFLIFFFFFMPFLQHNIQLIFSYYLIWNADSNPQGWHPCTFFIALRLSISVFSDCLIFKLNSARNVPWRSKCSERYCFVMTTRHPFSPTWSCLI